MTLPSYALELVFHFGIRNERTAGTARTAGTSGTRMGQEPLPVLTNDNEPPTTQLALWAPRRTHPIAACPGQLVNLLSFILNAVLEFVVDSTRASKAPGAPPHLAISPLCRTIILSTR
jgi:hypothetical protein